MTLQKVDPKSARQIMCIYGPPTCGKTRLATSLPDPFGDILYVAIDAGSEALKSVLPHYQKRIEVIRMTGDHPRLGMLSDMHELCITDWKGKKTMVIDTPSRLTNHILNYATSDKMGMVKKQKDVNKQNWGQIGNPDDPGFIQLAEEAHYGALNTVMLNFINNLINMQPNMNLIFVCHEQAPDEKTPLGGPGFAGRAVAKWFPGECQDAVIRVARREDKKILSNGQVEKTVRRLAYFGPHGSWMARRAENATAPTEETFVELDVDPINFWNKLDELNGK